jgi:Nitroreductase family
MLGSPTLLFVIYDSRKRAPASAGDFLGIMGLGCVMENMWLMAKSLGVGVQIISSVGVSGVEDEIKQMLDIRHFMRIAHGKRVGFPFCSVGAKRAIGTAPQLVVGTLVPRWLADRPLACDGGRRLMVLSKVWSGCWRSRRCSCWPPLAASHRAGLARPHPALPPRRRPARLLQPRQTRASRRRRCPPRPFHQVLCGRRLVLQLVGPRADHRPRSSTSPPCARGRIQDTTALSSSSVGRCPATPLRRNQIRGSR